MCADRECCDDPDGDVATDGDATHETDDRPEEDTDIDTGEALRKALHEIEDNLELKRKLTISNFGIERFSKESKMIKFYTGFQDYLTFVTFFTWIQPAANTMKSMYHQASDTISLAGNETCFSLMNWSCACAEFLWECWKKTWPIGLTVLFRPLVENSSLGSITYILC